MFRTLWNGWTTSARFQQVGCCVKGCSSTADDRIEHYCKCRFFKDLACRWMGLPGRLASLEGFLLAADEMTDKEMVLMAVAVYAMHRATARYRRESKPTPDQVRDFLQAMCQSAVRGHSVSTRYLDEATRLRHATARASINGDHRHHSTGGARGSRDRSRSPRRQATNLRREGPTAPTNSRPGLNRFVGGTWLRTVPGGDAAQA